MTKIYRILQVCRITPLWGMDLFQEITKAFTAPHYQVTTVFLSGPNRPEFQQIYHGDVHFFNINNRGWFWRLRAWWRLRRLCRNHHYDLVICHHYKPTMIMHWVSKFIKVNKLYSMHHNFGNFRHKSTQIVLKYLIKQWKFIAVSDALKQELIGLNVPEKQIVTIHNTINEKQIKSVFTKQEAREQLNLDPDIFVFGTLSRLVKGKGHLILLPAFAKLVHEQHVQANLAIIGTGPLENELMQLAHKLGIADKFHIITNIAREGARYLRAFDAFVFPSLSEAFGIALLEAMLAELPIITTTVGGIPEAVGNYADLIPPHDIDALATAMGRLYQDSAQERKMCGANNAAYVKAQYSVANYHQAFRNLLEVG